MLRGGSGRGCWPWSVVVDVVLVRCGNGRQESEGHGSRNGTSLMKDLACRTFYESCVLARNGSGIDKTPESISSPRKTAKEKTLT